MTIAIRNEVNANLDIIAKVSSEHNLTLSEVYVFLLVSFTSSSQFSSLRLDFLGSDFVFFFLSLSYCLAALLSSAMMILTQHAQAHTHVHLHVHTTLAKKRKLTIL